MLTLQIARLAQYHQSSSRESYSAPPWWNVRSLAGTRGATIFSFTVLFQHTNFRLRTKHLTIILRVTNPKNTLALHLSEERTVNSTPIRDSRLGYKGTVPPSHRSASRLPKRDPGPHAKPPRFFSVCVSGRARTAPLTQTRFFGTRYTWYHTGFLGQRHIFGLTRTFHD